MHQHKANLKKKYTIALRENKEFWASGKAYKKEKTTMYYIKQEKSI